MSKEYSQNKKIDRSSWPSGPWDSEPDFHEWSTKTGYAAYAARLNSGAWYGIIIAPYPTDGKMMLAFSHTLRDKRRTNWHADHKDPHEPGCISKSDVEGVGEWSLSMEHYDAPLPSEYHSWSRGPYVPLSQVIEICESVAQDIFDIHKEGIYVNYFEW